MRIEGTRSGHVGEHVAERAHPAHHAAAPAPQRPGVQPGNPGIADPSAAQGEASVVVSTGATAISKASDRDQAAQAERLGVVRAQLQAGTYKVDRDALARKLVDEELARRG